MGLMQFIREVNSQRTFPEDATEWADFGSYWVPIYKVIDDEFNPGEVVEYRWQEIEQGFFGTWHRIQSYRTDYYARG